MLIFITVIAYAIVHAVSSSANYKNSYFTTIAAV